MKQSLDFHVSSHAVGQVWRVVALALAFASPAAFAAPPDLRLIEAIRHSDPVAVRVLLKQKIDVNAAQPDGSTALHWAVYHDDREAVELLLGAGANVNARNDFGATPLWIACSEGRTATVERLLRAGADPNMPLQTGETPLMAAARTGNVEAVKPLLTHHANVNAKESSRSQTALMWAVAEQHPDAVRMLIQFGADVKARTNERTMFVDTGPDGLKRAPDDFSDFMNEEQGGFTPLLFAARVGDASSAALLLDAGADVNDAAPNGASVLVVAAHSGHPDVVKLLLERGANPNTSGAGYTALHAAILRGSPEMVEALLAHKADPNAAITKGSPVRRNSEDWAINAAWVGVTPIWLAARFADAGLMRMLAAAGADPRITRKDGFTILLAPFAPGPGRHGISGFEPPDRQEVERQDLEAVRAALDLGTDINAANAAGDTALHLAAAGKFNPVVEFLVKSGAKVDVKNKKGETPLTLAGRSNPYYVTDKSGSGTVSTTELLRKLGAVE